MRTLCIDTSVVAVMSIVEDGVTLGTAVDPDPRHQAEGLSLLLSACLADAGLVAKPKDAGFDRIVVGTGPGPFTALRAGIAFASALGQGLGLPTLGVPSLDTLGLQALELPDAGEVVLVMTDARRKEVYAAAYSLDAGGPDPRAGKAVMSPWVGKIGEVPLGSGVVGAAEGSLEEVSCESGVTPVRTYFSGAIPSHLEAPLADLAARPLALDPAYLAKVIDRRLTANPGESFTLEPLYLRRPDIHGMPA